MPRPTRSRTSLPGHSKAASASKTIATPDALDDSYMMDPAEMAPMQAPRVIEQAVDVPAPAEVPLDEVAKHHKEGSGRPRITKAEKAQAKRQNLLDQINSRATPYSKSHSRRLKRAARPEANLVASLSDFQDVLPEIEPAFDEPTSDGDDVDGMDQEGVEEEQFKQSNGGKGKEKLTAKKRQRVLTSESTRLPAILANSSFSKSPFATIRMHTLNTMAAQKAQEEAAASKKKKGGKK
ncbi:hypothetical protein JCM16303_004308 [Sporobolomyces ruberrimus]